ncbi:DeoR/GlpR transcriptional regulator [Chitinophaga sp. Cy-1792]|nr:DeoR/GlpR transcriptional regulator [Chitinophaga sp. Cy-1792]
MLKEERLEYILKKLQTDHKVLQTELSTDLQVSEDTVRRDLDALALSGRLIKVRGGAIPHSPNPYNFNDRIVYHEADKKQIAAKALSFIQDGQTIIMDGGTSTLTLAKMLPPTLKATIITNCVPIAAQLIDHPNVELILTGGRVTKASQNAGGLDTIRMLQRIKADICFLGVCSLHEETGVSCVDFNDTEVKSVMVESAYKTIVLATSEKMGTAEPFKVCEITNIDTIITDKPELPSLKPYIDLGIQVI